MASKKTTSEVATKAESAVAAFSYEGFEGAGFENQTNDDVTIPFLGVLQALSPQLKKDGIPGAQAGMLVNTVSEDIFDGDEGVLFVPGTTEHCFIEWVPRDSGGGFVGRHETDSEVVLKAQDESEKFGKYKVGANDLVETFYVYGVLCPDGEVPQPIVIGFTSTKIGIYKKWNSKLRMFVLRDPKTGGTSRPPIFSHLTRIKTHEEKNNHGEFFNFTLEPANGAVRDSLLPTDDERFLAAYEVGQMVGKGEKHADYANSAGGTTGGGSSEPDGSAADINGEAPPF